MIYYAVKVLISAVIIVAVTEFSKKSSMVGGIFASIPLVSVLALIWLYIDTHDVEKISQLSTSIFWLVIPSLSLFLVLPYLLKLKWGFYPSLTVATIVMVVLYYIMIFVLARFGVKI
jgi:hypothetical protein